MKNIRREEIEIMAPVGSYESLMAAIDAGANSVYFGIEKLNMRSRSSVNFSAKDLKEIVSICKQNGVKTYLALNIVLYDNEINTMHQVVDLAKDNGVDAIIASDLSAILYARQKNIDVHISTQLNVSNTEAVKFFSTYSDVMVLARELNLDQVYHIHTQINDQKITGPTGENIRIEMFCHGALCMSVSGKCYLSLHEYNYSANRGACLQTCRRGYTVKDKETSRELDIDNEYIMSPKDLSTIHFLNKMIDAGVRVFKIEGRARPAEYVQTVVSCYNEAIHAVLNDNYTPEKITNWQERLKTVFNRGFWDGYYLGQKLGEWSHVYGSKATQKKIYVAKATNYFSNIGVGEFLAEAGTVAVGDEIIISGPTTGVIRQRISEIRVDREIVNQAEKGELFSIQTDKLIRRSDKLYKIVDEENKTRLIR